MTKCPDCSYVMERKGIFACGTCEIWPLCGKCILQKHLRPCASFNVAIYLHQNIWSIGHAIKKFDAPREAKIKKMKVRMETRLSEARDFNQSPLGTCDKIFRKAVDSAVDQLDQYYQLIIAGLEIFEDVKGDNDRMLNFYDCDLGKPAVEMEIRKVVFADGWTEKVKRVVAFDTMLSAEMETRMEEAVVKVEKLIRLLKSMVILEPKLETKDSESEAMSRRRNKSFSNWHRS